MDSNRQTPKEAMGAHQPPAPPTVIPPGQVAYERTDIDARSVTRIAIVLGVLTAGAAGVVFGLFQLFADRAKGNDPPPPPLSRPAGGALAPEPRLQTAPVADLARVQAEERRALGAYGWADEAGQVARIPIEEAMALYAGQAARLAPPPPSGAPSALPSGAPPLAAAPAAAPASPPAGAR